MTNEEAIEILRKNRPTSDPRPCGMELCDAVDMAISALRQKYAADKDAEKWISVKDRLPEYFTGVLVWCPENACTYAAYRNVREEWHTFDDSVAWCALQHDVTHWMPLPEPPKGE